MDTNNLEAQERNDLCYVMGTEYGKRFLVRLLQDLGAFRQCSTQEDVCLRNSAEILIDSMGDANPVACLEIIRRGRGLLKIREGESDE